MEGKSYKPFKPYKNFEHPIRVLFYDLSNDGLDNEQLTLFSGFFLEKLMEPVSTSGFTALLKLYGIAIMVTLAVGLVAAVVLMTRMPRSPQEWAVGLICTVVSSLAGGSFIIVKWGLHEWVTDVWGMIALGGFFFVCGLPGWALVRWIFNFIDKQEGKTIVEVIKEFKKARKDIENS